MTGPLVDTVVKFGGGALADGVRWREGLDALRRYAERTRVLVVPGGGPFAATVRSVDALVNMDATTSHWMAILAMDQYAELLRSRIPGAVRVESRSEITDALGRRALPVLAPSRWLRTRDPLPHSWEVTSDSIAAWIAGELGARRLLLVKPAEARPPLVDPYFRTALPPSVTAEIVTVADFVNTQPVTP